MKQEAKKDRMKMMEQKQKKGEGEQEEEAEGDSKQRRKTEGPEFGKLFELLAEGERDPLDQILPSLQVIQITKEEDVAGKENLVK